MRILVTGGAGFIGSHLCERLLADGHLVTVVDDLSSGRLENLGAARMFKLNDRSDAPGALAVHLGDAADRGLMAPLVAGADFVFHLAATVGVFQYMRQPVRTVLNNIEATAAVLACCVERGTPCLLTSTSEVYGKSDAVPFREESDVTLGPTSKSRWGYAASKMVDEFLALAYHRQFDLPVRIVRLFNTVGPRQTGRYGMVVPRFVQQAMAGKPLTVFGTGQQTRCFCSVHDVVEGLVALMDCPGAVGRVVNLGTDGEVSVNQLARLVLGSAFPDIARLPEEWTRHVPYSEAYGPGFDEMMRRVPDLTRARELIGWLPKWSLTGILAEMTGEPAHA